MARDLLAVVAALVARQGDVPRMETEWMATSGRAATRSMANDKLKFLKEYQYMVVILRRMSRFYICPCLYMLCEMRVVGERRAHAFGASPKPMNKA